MFVMQLSLKAFQGLHQTFSWHGYIRCSFLKKNKKRTFKCCLKNKQTTFLIEFY